MPGFADVTMTVQDGALGIVPQLPTNSQVALGVCTLGAIGTLYSFVDQRTMQSTLGAGPLVEKCARVLADAGGPVYALPLNPSAFGYAGTVTQVGTGTGTVTVALGPTQTILITITTGGALGTSQFTYKVGNGPASAPQPTVATFAVPGTFTTLTFSAGNYVLNSTYTFNTDGSPAVIGGGGINTVTQQSSPIDAYSVQIKMITGGALATAQFQFSLDGGNTFSGTVTTPGGSGRYVLTNGVLGNTGIVVVFSGTGTFAAGDVYSFLTTPPGYSTTDVVSGFSSLFANSTQWFMVHVVGTPTSATAAAALAATVDTQMTTAQTNYRFAFGMLETPTVGSIVTSGTAAIADTVDTDTNITTQFASFVSVRTAVCAGDCDLVSPLTGKIHRRPCSWTLAARLSAISPGTDGAWVAKGPLPGVRKLYRDEFATPALDAAFFCTLRTYPGLSGFYATNLQTFALATSDFSRISNRRVMDLACTVVRSALLPYLNQAVRVNAATGYILEQDARAIESDVGSQLKNSVVNTTPPSASAASVQLSRTSNILSTSSEPVTVRVTPLGYFRTLAVNIGFFNPALSS
jgi:hypothetical protein